MYKKSGGKQKLGITIIMLMLIISIVIPANILADYDKSDYETQASAPSINSYFISPDWNGCTVIFISNQSDSHLRMAFARNESFNDSVYYWDNTSQDIGGGEYRYDSSDMANALTPNVTYYYNFTIMNGTDNSLNTSTNDSIALWDLDITLGNPLDRTFEQVPNNPVYLNVTVNSKVGSQFNVTWYSGYYFDPIYLTQQNYSNNASLSFKWMNVTEYGKKYLWCIRAETCYPRALPDNGEERVRDTFTKEFGGWGERNNWTFWTQNDTITFTLVEPLNISISDVEEINITWNISTKGTRINNDTILFARSATYDGTLNGKNWSFMCPANEVAPNVTRGHGRNLDFWFEQFNQSGTDELGWMGEWACGAQPNSSKFNILDYGSNWTLVQVTPCSCALFPNFFYLDRKSILHENKTGQYTSIYENNKLKTEFDLTGVTADVYGWNNNWSNATHHIFVNANATSGTQPLKIYFVNESYTSGKLSESPYASFIGQVDVGTPYDISISNSNYYVKTFATNNGTIGGVTITGKYYFVFASDADYDDAWKLYYADDKVTSGTGTFDFMNTTVAQVSTNNGTTWYDFGNDTTDDEVLYLKFNEGAGDNLVDSSEIYSGHYHNGTRQGATWNASGHEGSCLDFNGTTDYVNVTNDPDGHLNFTDEMTIALWINPDTLTSYDYWIAKEDSFRFGTGGDRNRPRFSFFRSGWKEQQTNADWLVPNNWYHLAVTFNSTEPETVTYYVNGTKVYTKAGYTGSGNMEAGTGDIIIGMEYDLTHGFEGSIDDVRLWSRALSPDEIYDVYSNTTRQGTPDVNFNVGSSDSDSSLYKIYAELDADIPNGTWSQTWYDVLGDNNLPPNDPNIEFPVTNDLFYINESENISIYLEWIGDPNHDNCTMNVSFCEDDNTLLKVVANETLTCDDQRNNYQYIFNFSHWGYYAGDYKICVNITEVDNQSSYSRSEVNIQLTELYINRSSIYPSDFAEDIPINLSYLSVNINHSYGENFNITWKLDNCSSGTIINITEVTTGNGTFTTTNTSWVTEYGTDYTWTVCVNETGSVHWRNLSFVFRTEEKSTYITLEGLTDIWNVTWSGNSTEAAVFDPIPTYCNSSGIRNTTVVVNLTVDGIRFIEKINVSIGNLTNITNHWYHNADNITLYISGDNVSWEILQYDAGNGMGVFPTDGGNLTINQTIWGVFLHNPWDYHGQEGLIVENCSLYLRFRCNLTIDLNDGEYKEGYFRNETDNPWKVYIVNNSEIYDTDTFTAQLRNGLEPHTGCCLDVNKTVWNGTDWVKWYRNTTVGQEVIFNISIHNCGGQITDNISIYDTAYDALWEYVPGSAKIKYPGEDWRKTTANSSTSEEGNCGYPIHSHVTFHIPRENLTNFTYCNYIYLHYNRSINNQNYSYDTVGVYTCEYDFEWWDSICYNLSSCYVNEWFNDSIICDCQKEESSNWTVSEHIKRPCVDEGCYDEEWSEYETEFGRWETYNDSDHWEWVYRYDNLDGNGTDINRMSYTIVNDSYTNRSLSILRMRYNWTYSEDPEIYEPNVGLIYAYTSNESFDMVLYGDMDTYMLSKRGDKLYNTEDMSPIEWGVIDYFDSGWSTDPDSTEPIDPSQESNIWNGIWAKTIYNEYTGNIKTKAWQINSTQPFGLDFEPPGWIVNRTFSDLVNTSAKCFGLVVWARGNYTNFTADFDFIEDWRLNYSRDGNATESQLENHSVYGSDGIPLINFPTQDYFNNEWISWTEFYNCYDEYDAGNLTSQQYADCISCFYRNLTRHYNMESRLFNSTIYYKETQPDNIYYYTGVWTNISAEAPFNNSLVIHIEDCTDGTDTSYDGAVVCFDLDNDYVWDDNDMVFYWYTDGIDTYYAVYNGTTNKYFGRTSEFNPEMEVWFVLEMTNSSYQWYTESMTQLPHLHRFSPHRVYEIIIPLYYLEKDHVGSENYLNATDTFGLHIQTTDNDYLHGPVWENWNESSGEVYTVDENDGLNTFETYLNCTDWNACVDFEQGIWNGVNQTHIQYWGHGRIGNETGPLIESTSRINVSKTANVSTITNIEKDNIVNYTIEINNIGDRDVTGIVVNDTFDDGVYYIGSSLPGVNVTNPSDNIYIFNVTHNLGIGDRIYLNITVNLTAGCEQNGSNITNLVNCYTNESANATTTHVIIYGTNKLPIITAAYPYINRTITDISLLLAGMNATVEDPNGDNIDVYFYTNKTINLNVTGNYVSYWHNIGQTIGATNNTFETNQTFNMDDDNNRTRWRWGTTSYWWSVNATDGIGWTNITYKFLTDLSRYDVQAPLGVVSAADAQKTWSRVGTTYDGLYDVQIPYSVLSGADAQKVWSQL